MRVTADADFTAVIQAGQMLTVHKGQIVEGDVATYLLRSGAPVTPETPETPQAETFDVKAATIDDVLAWVDDDSERALEAHTLEESKGDKARPRLLTRLAEIVES